MIHFLTLPEGAGHIDIFIDRFDRSYGRQLVEVTYQKLRQRGVAQPGVYIFTDRDRMNSYQRQVAGAIRRKLLSAGPGFKVLGDPEGQLGRLELLAKLSRENINDYRVHVATKLNPDDLRYPVFVRIEDDHMGPRSELLHTWAEVVQSVAGLVLAGFAKSRILVIEYIDTKGDDGLYRKYGSFRIGPAIVCQHILHATAWLAKRDTTIRTPELVELSDNFYHTNPHHELLMPIFDAAGVDYGRIDYSFAEGRIQVWEINDNPMYFGRRSAGLSKARKDEAFMKAFAKLDTGLAAADPIPLVLDIEDIRGAVLT